MTIHNDLFSSFLILTLIIICIIIIYLIIKYIYKKIREYINNRTINIIALRTSETELDDHIAYTV